MTDGSDDERAPRESSPSEGVRILGAEEARRALEAQRRGDAPPADGTPDKTMELELDLSEEDEAAGRRVHYVDSGPTWSASAAGEVPLTEEPSGEVPPLPHWTEPPTGAVPAIFADADDGAGGDDLDAWAPITGGQPRFRAEGSDWVEADFATDDLGDEALNVGALKEPTVIDEDEAFAQELAERRRRTPRGRAPRTMVTTPPPAPRTPRPRPARPEPEPDVHPAPGRDLPTALVTAGGVALAALICFNQGTWWTAGLAAVIVGLGTLEFTAALQARGFRPAALLALIASATLPLAAKAYGADAYPVFFALLVIVTMLWFLWEVTPGRPLLGVATTVLAFGYVGGLGGFAGLLLASDDGVGLVLGLALCVITYDVLGFFVGSQFGKSPIAPKTSPNKTFEGTVAGMLGAVLMGWLLVGGQLGPGIHPWSPGRGAVLGLFIAAGAFLGDLCESMLKRDLGVKDFGSLLPGHGGVLDRFDAILFCMPITYYLALHFNIL